MTLMRFKEIAEASQAVVVCLGVVIGGAWTATTFWTLSEATKAKAETMKAQAEHEKLRIETELARRSLASEQVVNVTMSAASHRRGAKADQRWVVVEVGLSNSGNKPVRLTIGGNLRFYVARVEGIEQDGSIAYDHRFNLRFHYPDKVVTWLMLRPGAQIERLQSVQQVDRPGMYLARFALQLPDEGVGEGREYGADTYFLVQ